MAEDAPKPERKILSIFKDGAGSFDTLRATYRDRRKMPDPTAFLSELGGESDRAGVILAASMLDDLLAHALAQAMAFEPDEKEFARIFKSNSPLGSFSSRAEVALYFGVIDDETWQQLNIIREMTNACAHSKHPLDFKSPELINVDKRLFAPPLGFTPKVMVAKDLKQAFGIEVAFLGSVLTHGRAEATALAVGYVADHVASREKRD